MISLKNIKKLENGHYSMNCHVYDLHVKNPDFSLEFDPVNIEIFSKPVGEHMIDDVYAKCAVRHIYYLIQNNETIPSESTAAWF